jgi:hypothetical protein
MTSHGGYVARWSARLSRHVSNRTRPAPPARRGEGSLFGHGQMQRQEDGAYVMRVSTESSLFLRQLSR